MREDLKRRGHRFSTQTDTEVILHLYEEEEEDCVHRLNGQWAFAIWDGNKGKLLLSRDRLGVRPLFYTRAGDSLAFASEIKALFTLPHVRNGIDPVGLDQVFTFWNPILDRTAFRDVRQLPPGHCMSIQKGSTRTYRYWSQHYDGSSRKTSEQDCAEELRELLIEATRIRLRADVPVGAYLSGGLDSTVITGIISRFSKNRLNTFSVAFTDPEYDERSYQRDAAQHLGTNHREIQCSYEDIAKVFPEVVHHTESPIVRTAPAPFFVLSKLVRQSGLKVVLTGEGADEILGGYDIYKEAKIRRFWARQPDSRRRPLLLRRLYPYMLNLHKQPDSYLRRFFHVAPEDLSNPFFSHLPRWNLTARLKSYYSADIKAELAHHDSLRELRDSLHPDYHSWDAFEQAQYLETNLLLPGYILSSQGDRMAMAHSVEGRFPFLDPRVVELAARIPPGLKMRVLNEKHILKRALGDLVPSTVLRRPKQPYRAPEARSFFDGSRAREEYVEDMLSPGRIREFGVFNCDPVELLVRKVKEGRAIGARDNMALVGILSTQLLMDQFIYRRNTGCASNTE